MPIKILIVDDHSVVRQGLQIFLKLEPEFKIVGEATNGKEALTKAAKLQPDVVLMDILMPIMNGIEATEAIKHNYPEIEVIALTSVLEDSLIAEAIQVGAVGYLLKDTEADELIKAIIAAANGKIQLSPQVADRLMKDIRPPENPEKLTERETEVLQLIAKGKSNKEIANDLVISETTVKSHVSNILMKLGLPSRTRAALYAIRIGLISKDSDYLLFDN